MARTHHFCYCRENVFESKMEPYREYACALYKDEENPTITALLRDSQVTDTYQQLHTLARSHAPGMLPLHCHACSTTQPPLIIHIHSLCMHVPIS